MASEYLFVYGTLRQKAGHELHGLLTRYGRLVGPASCQGRLFRVKDYPALVPSMSREDRVRGELFRLLDTRKLLPVLDAYESYLPGSRQRSLFLREKIPVNPDNGQSVTAWVYRYNRSVRNLPRIESGDYLADQSD